MAKRQHEERGRNLTRRVTAIEKILPTLATKADLLELEVATKAELAAQLAATKAELRAEIKGEGERTRQHFDVVAESIKGDLRVVIDGMNAKHERADRELGDVRYDVARLDRRVTRLEAAELKRR